MYHSTARLLLAEDGIAVIAHPIERQWLGTRWAVTVYWTLADTGETAILYDHRSIRQWASLVVGMAKRMYEHGLPDHIWRQVAALPRPK